MADAETETVNGGQDITSDETSYALVEEEEKRELEEKKKAREPPIVYKELIDVSFVIICLNKIHGALFVNIMDISVVVTNWQFWLC